MNINFAPLKEKLHKATAIASKSVVVGSVALVTQQASAAGLSDLLGNTQNLGVLAMNVVLVLASCFGAYLAVTGMMALNPKSNGQSNVTVPQAFAKIGIGCVMVSALFFINETSKEFTGEQSTTFNSNLTNS